MELTPFTAIPAPLPEISHTTKDAAALRQSAQEFEAVFLAEMLKYSGINKAPAQFNGGAGEDAFSSLLTQEYARLLAERGGIGLAEHIFEALTTRTSEQ